MLLLYLHRCRSVEYESQRLQKGLVFGRIHHDFTVSAIFDTFIDCIVDCVLFKEEGEKSFVSIDFCQRPRLNILKISFLQTGFLLLDDLVDFSDLLQVDF